MTRTHAISTVIPYTPMPQRKAIVSKLFMRPASFSHAWRDAASTIRPSSFYSRASREAVVLKHLKVYPLLVGSSHTVREIGRSRRAGTCRSYFELRAG